MLLVLRGYFKSVSHEWLCTTIFINYIY